MPVLSLSVPPLRLWDIAFVGSSIGGASQMTIEACSYIHHARAVYCLPTSPAEWRFLKRLNPNTVNLFRTIYKQGVPFSDAYDEIENTLMAEAKKKSRVVYAVPGNPAFYAFPVHKMLGVAAEEGLRTVIAAGVSSFDLFLTELRIEVGYEGAQLYNALFLEEQRPPLNIDSHCFIFQIGVLGLKKIDQERGRSSSSLTGVQSYLLKFYDKKHPCHAILFMSDRKLRTERISFSIDKLASMSKKLQMGHTLYIPPRPSSMKG